MLPALFVSHGAPTLPLDDVPARDFLKTLAERFERPRAILCISAHWDTHMPTVNAVAANDTIHDFYGFPDALYRMQYAAPGSVALAARVAALLQAGGLPCETDSVRGLDHGAWVPLLLAYPKGDIPVVQLSIQMAQGPEHHVRLGRALTALRGEGVLVIGSGSFVHNLRMLARGSLHAPEPAWTSEFSAWVHAALVEGRTADLVRYRIAAPHAVMAHPSEDHFLPLFAALGAGGDGARASRIHTSTTLGSLRMDTYAFQ